ncbi:MAG: hypothetical protein DHS20C14_15800 [Phycisphaeraceae bacterium]|nr:MAG: hypothetical protein DHS20C14_15800 [Phycisphaeraceae bacterium]
MAKKRSTKSKSKAKAADPERRRRIMLVSVTVLGGLALTAGGWVGLDRLDAHAAELATFPSVEVTFAWPAIDGAAAGDESTWMPNSERERLTRIALDAARGGSGLDHHALREVSRALHATGWYAELPVVRRQGDGNLRVTGTWRLPAAVVRTGSLERLVSWEGVALPLEYGAGKSGVHYLAFASTPPPAVSGVAWEGEDVRAGLALLDLLDDHADLIPQIVGIDLDHGGPLTIITDEGGKIIWGTAPGVFRPGEQSSEIKISRIGGMLDKTGRIDGGLAAMDIRGSYVLTQKRSEP